MNPISPKTRRKFNLHYKIKVVREYECNQSLRATAKKYGITRATLRKWIKIKQSIKNSNMKIKRARVISSRKAFFPELEAQLNDFIIDRRRRLRAVVTGTTILNQARLIANRNGISNFQGSRGWLGNFLARHNYCLRRISSKGRLLPANAKELILDFHNNCKNTLSSLTRSQIYSMDETAIELDRPGNYSYEIRGSQGVEAGTSGGERTKISILFCCSADGNKLDPLIIVPRKKPLKDYVPPDNVVLHYKQNSKSFDSNVIINGFINRVITPHKMRAGQSKSVLILDNAPCHKTKEVKERFCESGIDLLYIPPRMTGILQPPDVSWFKILKQEYHKRWTEWYLSDDKAFTQSGNLKSPGYAKIIDWISEIWTQFNKNLIMESFDQTGITCYDQESFHSTLNHILNSSELPATTLSDYDGTEDLEGVFEDDINDSDYDDELENDSDDESNSDDNEESDDEESDDEESDDESDSNESSSSENGSDSSESNEIRSTQVNRKRKSSPEIVDSQQPSMSLRPRKIIKKN